eukprot:1139767-Pelagomonas_calceolata.AAC.1
MALYDSCGCIAGHVCMTTETSTPHKNAAIQLLDVYMDKDFRKEQTCALLGGTGGGSEGRPVCTCLPSEFIFYTHDE